MKPVAKEKLQHCDIAFVTKQSLPQVYKKVKRQEVLREVPGSQDES